MRFKPGDRVRDKTTGVDYFVSQGASDIAGYIRVDFGPGAPWRWVDANNLELVPDEAPSFKPGDRVRSKRSGKEYIVAEGSEDYAGYTWVDMGATGYKSLIDTDDLELVPRDVLRSEPGAVASFTAPLKHRRLVVVGCGDCPLVGERNDFCCHPDVPGYNEQSRDTSDNGAKYAWDTERVREGRRQRWCPLDTRSLLVTADGEP